MSDRPDDGAGAVPHMTPERFRAEGVRAVEWVARYMETVGDQRVAPETTPGEVYAALPDAAPERGEDDAMGGMLADLERLVVPNSMHWQHPSFFGYFPCGSSGPAVIAELLSAGLGVQGMLWSTGPACTEVETRMLDWMGEAIGLPPAFLSPSRTGGGSIQGTASESAVVALVAGRRRLAERVEEREGRDAVRAIRPVVYASQQAHSSIAKAAVVTGVALDAADDQRIRLVPVDEACRMRPDELERMLREDVAAGLHPVMLCVTLGTTGSTAIDPLDACARVWREHAPDGWLHIDAAHAGAMLVCPEHRSMLEGVEHADSLCFNPHKWLLVNFDCDLFWTRDRAALTGALSITPEYLRNDATDAGAVIDYRDWQVPLGRRFRALKLWAVLRHYGLGGLCAFVREHVAWAAWLEQRIREDDRFELLAERTMNLVCFADRRGDEATRGLMERLNASGRVFLSHTVLPGGQGDRYVIRVSIGATPTRFEHVEALWALIDAETGRVD
ncbi:MAG: pyridoxal-dependent decarboxylase [Planctomycetota bacterium]